MVICYIEPQSWGKKNIDSNRQQCESVCKPRDVCDGFIPQDAQNMTEPVWQLGRKRSNKTLKGARHNVCFLETVIQGCSLSL